MPAWVSLSPPSLLTVLVMATLAACSPDSGGHHIATGTCQQTGSRAAFTVATYNIHAGVGRDERRSLERIAETLSGADFVGLQEVDNERIRSGFENQARTIAGWLGHRYWQHFTAEDYWPFGTYGIAISSSLPVVASDSFELPIVEGNPARRLAWIKFLVDCYPIHAFVVHMTRMDDVASPALTVQFQSALRLIAEKTAEWSEPGIFMGDLNVPPTAPALRMVQERAQDVLLREQLPGGDTATGDYIFVWGSLDVLESLVKDDGSSDHPAIFARLRPRVS